MNTTTSFKPTLLRWYNSADGAKVASADVGTYEKIPYGDVRAGEVHANGKQPHPDNGGWQWGIACSRTSRTLVIDVDDADEYLISNLETYLPLDQAVSLRVTGDSKVKFHFVIVVPEELLSAWPKQGGTPWGDIKSNGFSYITGTHYTGTVYVATGKPFIFADADLMAHINAEPRSATIGVGSGATAGDWTDPSYFYRDGSKWTRGVADVASMVNSGMPDADIITIMVAILQRSENYSGTGQEVQGWIDSARSKYNIAEGETRQEAELKHIFGDAGYDRIMLRASQQQADWARSQAPLAYLQDRVGYIAAQFEDEGSWSPPQIPDLTRVDMAGLLNPSGVPIEPSSLADSDLADLFLEYAFGTPECPGILAYAADSGCWVLDYGQVWREWGAKSDAQQHAKSAVSAWATNIKTDAQLEAEERERTGDENFVAEFEIVPSPDGKGTVEKDTEYGARKKRLGKIRARLTSDAGTSAVASMVMAKVRNRADVHISDMDNDADVIWAGGTPWSLTDTDLTVAAEAIGRKHLKTCVVAPTPGPHPLWDEALAALFPVPAVREWAVRELAGACLWGATSKEHPVLDGKPNAGKSTVTDTIRKILGSYAVDVDPNKLIGGNEGSSSEEEKAAMIGARMVLLDEPPKRDRQSISQFNRIASGTGEISASAKYKNRVSGIKRFNMVINQNQRNRMKLDAEGVRQRLVFIPAEGHITVELYKRFNAGIHKEYPAILATLIRECALFKSDRMDIPHEAQMALDIAYADGDEFPQWLWDNYELVTEKTTGRQEDEMPGLDDLRKAYAEHVRTIPGVAALTRQQLRERLAEMEIRIKEYGGSLGKRHNVVLLKPLPAAQGINRW